ncbi:MAG: diguanylate cyclase [Actinomycetota bacterium]
MSASPASVRSHDPAGGMVSLAERMTSMFVVRAGLVAVVLVASMFGLAPRRGSLLVSVAFVGVSALLEMLRRATGRRGLAVIAAELLLDATYLSWVAYASGGAASPLRFLVYAHLVAVTLIASYRTGVKLAAWYSLLFLTTLYAEATGILPLRELIPAWLPGRGDAFMVPASLVLLGLWLVTLVTAALSALNERELRRRSLDLDTLAEMARDLDRSTDADDAADVLATRIAAWLGAERVLVLRGSGDGLRVVAAVPTTDPASDGRVFAPDDAVARAWRDRTPQLVRTPSPDGDPMLTSVLPDARNVSVTTMSAEGEIIGALVVEHGRRRDRIPRWTLAVLERFAAHAALVMRNATLLDEVRRMAATDGLTGIANRRTFDEALAREIARAERTGQPVTLVMLDVDHFKRLNDEHGHQAGDSVLQVVGKALSADLRPFDTAARYGGEEFAIILPGCTAEESRDVAERIRRRAGASSPIAGVTLSAGVATLPGSSRDATDLVRAADAALYEAKRAGRDRLATADAELTNA